MNTHMQVHSGERPFTCGVCSRGFTEAGSCRRHMKQHTGERPHTCEFCNKIFFRVDALKRHKKTHNRQVAM
ncbi:unnamed protein product [Gongylonema pulchrum]|uniref:C2H2-type domain-containing protein n=1 Tax=Gongylonema pulchrum TaxID=637853 RepID=A0A183EV95_9BILA|nr:unnamed protein product [Gongylonema pulchrum]